MGREKSISRSEMRVSTVITETDADMRTLHALTQLPFTDTKEQIERLVKLQFLSDQCHFRSDKR